MKPTYQHADSNQKAVVSALVGIGATVCDLSGSARWAEKDTESKTGERWHTGGTSDLLVGYAGLNLLIEVKNPEGRNRVDPKQAEFNERWRGKGGHVVRSPQEAVEWVIAEAARAGT